MARRISRGGDGGVEGAVDAASGAELVVLHGVDGEAEGLRDGDGVGEIEIGLVVESLALVVAIAGAGFAVEADLVGVLVDVGFEAELGAAGLEGGAADHVDGTAEAGGGHVGRRDFGDLDAGGVVE